MSEQSPKYIDHVMSLFGLRRAANANARAVPSPGGHRGRGEGARSPGAAASAPSKEHEAFERDLAAFAAERNPGDSLVTGRVHMINVEKVRERLGDQGQRFEKRIHEVIQNELKTRLSVRDLYRRMGEDSYVIAFGDCSEVEARLKVALLSEQILEKLLGETEAKNLQALGVQRLVTKEDGIIAAEALESTDALLARLQEAQRAGAPASTFDMGDMAVGRRALAPEEAAHCVDGIDLELVDLETGVEEGASVVVKIDRLRGLLRQLGSLEEAMRVKVTVSAPPDGRGSGREQVARIEGSQPVLERIEDARARAERQIALLCDHSEAKAEPAPTEAALDVRFAYHPLWHAPSNRVGIYACQATLLDGDGRLLELAELDEDQEGDVLAIVDRLALRRVRSDQDKASTKGIPSIVMVPVHFSTLRRYGSRTSFMTLCSHLPEEQRKTLTWEIVGSHVDSWSLQLESMVKPLAPFGRAVFLRIANPQADFAGVRRNLPYLRGAGVHAVGVDLQSLEGREAEKLRLLERIAELAESNGLKCYGHGFDSLSLTISAVCMGYQNVSGPAIAEPAAEPEGIRATEMETIYERMLARGAASVR